MPYSRATIELWLSGPPMSVTTAAGPGEQGGPGRGGDRGDQHLPGLQLREVGRPGQHPGDRGDPAGAGADPGQHVAGLLGGGRRHHRAQPIHPGALGQQLRRRGPALTAPDALGAARPAAAGPAAFRGRSRSPARRHQNTSSGRSSTPAATSRSPELGQHPAQLRPGQAHVGEGVLPDRGDGLGPPQQRVEGAAADRVQPAPDHHRGRVALLLQTAAAARTGRPACRLR